eukprot:scaffold2955_cov203-Chaetoceros_neogracile.AAC.3
MGAKEVDDDGNEVDSGDENGENGGKGGDTNNDAKHGITHEFDLLRDGNEAQPGEGSEETFGEAPSNRLSSNGEEGPKTLLIRELPIKDADNPFDEGDEKLDTTGLGIWSASIVMARWMASKASLGRFDDKNVLELGAGCAVPGLALGMYSDAKVVYITDYNPATIDNLKYNIDINANRPCTKSRAGEWLERIKPLSIDWADEATWPKEKMDFVIGSDLIYQKSIVPLLKKVVNGLIKDNGSFLYTCPSDGRDGLVEFIETMKNEGFRCVSEEVAPDLYRSNPLSNGDAEDAFLHFYELPTSKRACCVWNGGEAFPEVTFVDDDDRICDMKLGISLCGECLNRKKIVEGLSANLRTNDAIIWNYNRNTLELDIWLTSAYLMKRSPH